MKARYFTLLLLLPVIFANHCKILSSGKYNVILIVPDALRARQLPIHGYSKIKTPNIDALAEESVDFKNCFVKRATTYTSFSNLFSGLLFPRDGLLGGEKTMAEFFREKGYRTMGVVSSSILWSSEYQEKGRVKNQFYRGFDDYFQDASLKKYPYCRKNEPTTKDILNWLETHKKDSQPFFLFAHYMDPHAPYKPSYDGEIEKIDSELGQVIGKLKELNLYENSIIIFTSDHGESLGDPVIDHGSPQGHGWITYNEQHHIPLLIKFPKNRYVKSVTQIVRNMDILPTLLDYLGFSYKQENFDGKSLLPVIKEGKDLELSAFLQSNSNRICPEGQYAIIFSYKDDFFKFIRGGYSKQIRELYNISTDMGERNNLIADSRYNKVLNKAIYLIRDFERKARSQIMLKKNEKTIDNPEEIKRLRALGYLEAGAPSQKTRANQFLMERDLYPIGFLKYHSFIREPMWGRYGALDPYFPVKITSAGQNRLYIIGNRNNELFTYRLNERWPVRVSGIEGVRDFAFDAKGKRLLLLSEEIIRSLDPVTSTIKEFKVQSSDQPGSRRFIYVDDNGNIYLLNLNNVLKLDNKGMVLKRYPFNVESSNLFSVDKKENIYFTEKNKILTYNNQDRFLTSVSVRNGLQDIEISAIFLDEENRIWVLEQNACTIHIFEKGNKITSFSYNNHRMRQRWKPIPTRHLYLNRDKVFITDKWEGIFVYKITLLERRKSG
ncbi:MAG: sulfatase [Candidatus Aminicenantes bacterium]|nr:sulfatase [Candidatus Aminicenantes bacterium]